MKRLLILAMSAASAMSVLSCASEASSEGPSFYVKLAETQARKALSESEKGEAADSFWLVWAATSPRSSLRGDQRMREAALKLYDAKTLEMESKPQSYWSLLPALESAGMWRDSEGEAMRERFALWLKRLRPSVEACFKSQNGSDWISIAPNTNHQAAASLQLAAKLYASADPSDPDPKRWSEQAALCVERSSKLQLPGGAFSYIRDSGPDPVYYNFDSLFLGRYWQLSGSEGARKSLERMAGWSESATVCGQLTAFSSPWWKHLWGTGGPYFGPEIVASLSGDPLTAGVMKLRRANCSQPYYFSYYSMEAFRPELPAKPVSNRCGFDGNANGQALRDGGFDVETPFRPWCESTCGASVSNERSVLAFINSVGLVAVDNEKQGFQGAYCVLASDPDAKSFSLSGDGWIAQACVWRPAIASCGHLPSGRAPWRRCDIWFADKNGFAGLVELKALEGAKGCKVEAWCNVSKDFEADGFALKTPELALTLEGLPEAFVPLDKSKKGPFVFKSPLAESKSGAFASGSTWSVKASAVRSGFGRLSVGRCASEGSVQRVEILLDGERRCLLSFDAGGFGLESDLPAKASRKVDATGASL